MRKVRPLLLPLSFAAAGIAFEVLLYGLLPAERPPATDGPRSLAEVARLAHRAGLYASSDRPDGRVVHRLIVSDRPISWLRANLLRFGAPDHPCWAGTVAVCFPARVYLANYDPDFCTLWGEVMLYGDRAVIRRLTGRG